MSSVPCRLCGDPTFLSDVHPCCEYWIERKNTRPCVACEASKAAARRWAASNPEEKMP